MGNNKIKVLHIIKTLDLGGAESNLYNLVTHLDSLRFENHVAYSCGGVFEEKFRHDSIILFKYAKKEHSVKSFSSLIIILKLIFYIVKYKIQIIHTHNFNGHIWGSIASLLTSAKVLEHVHDPRYECHDFFKKKGLPMTSQFRLALFFSRFSKIIIVLTKNNQAYLTSNNIALNEKVNVEYNGIPLNNYRFTDRNVICEKYNIAKDKKIIFTAMRLSVQKNSAFLLDIASCITKDRDDFLFVIAGDGPLKNKMELDAGTLHLENKVRFLGFCQNIKEILQISNIFILPTIRELHSLSMIEAMSMRVPVIVSKGAGCNDYFVTHGKNGFVLDPRNPIVWSKTILSLLGNVEYSKKVGLAGRKLVEKKCDIKYTAKNIEEYYLQLCRSN